MASNLDFAIDSRRSYARPGFASRSVSLFGHERLFLRPDLCFPATVARAALSKARSGTAAMHTHGKEPPFDRRARGGRLFRRQGAWRSARIIGGNVCTKTMRALPGAVGKASQDYFYAPAAVARLLFAADAIAAKSIAVRAVRRKRGVAIKGRRALGTKRASADGRCTRSVVADIAPGIAA